MRSFILATVTMLAVGSSAMAATLVATDNQTGPTSANPSNNSWTPSYDPINTSRDVLLGLAPSASSGNFALESSGGIPVLTNGVFGPIVGLGSDATHANWATVGGGSGSGSSLTYTFAAAPLSSLVVYGGWNDNGRDAQDYTVSYSTDGTHFTTLGSVNYNPSVSANTPSADRVTFTDSSGLLAGGALIDALQFTFNSSVENGYTGLAEIVANTVPEPSSLVAICGLAAAGLFFTLRRRNLRRGA